MQALVVADKATQRQLQDFFASRQYGVTACDRRAQALRAVDGATFQFAFLDLQHDESGALEVCQRIRAQAEGARTYVFVFPKNATPEGMRAALEAGADDYLLKPLDEAVLKLRLAIGQRTLTTRLQTRATDQQLERSERRYRTLVETMHEGLFQVNDRGVIEFANSRLSKITGYSLDELIGQSADELLIEEEFRQRLPEQTLLGSGTGSEEYSIPLKTKDGEQIWVNLTAAPMPALDSQAVGSVGVVQDISGQRDAEERLRHREAALKRERAFFEQLFRNSPSGIVILDNSDRVVDVNRAFVDLFQFEIKELAGKPLSDFIVPDELREEATELSQLVFNRQSVERETVRRRKDASVVDVAILGYPIELAEKRIGAFGLYSDITERKNAERKLFHDAFHDALTNLPNRTLLTERLERDLRRARRRTDYQFALFFIDLDRFKAINDHLGHAAGDQILVEVAERLNQCLRPGDTTARLGGDEFTVIVEDIKGPYDAVRVAERILEELSTPFHVGNQEETTSASIGIAFSSTGYERLEDLMRDADIAMYRAKARGRGCYEIFDPSMQEGEAERQRLESELGEALDHKQMVLHFQPVVSLSTGRLVSFEALVRWRHPTKGLILPDELIPVCEETGMIVPLGQWVLREGCRQLATWQERFPESDCLQLSVNVSVKELTHPGFLRELDRICKETGVKPPSIGLEVTEDLMAEAADQMGELLWEISRRGFRLIIDDFGLGRTSLRALYRYPIDALKIDRTFIAAMTPGEEHVEVVRAAAAIGDSLGLSVVAEGVETTEQAIQLRELGLGFAQGHLFSAPLPAKETAKLIADDPRW